MPIQALPQDTTRIIGSSLALNDAKSVVKELVDNALDACATTISIEISANTLDIVQVKDNGTGIDVQDRRLLFKRGCTSKIRTIDDLGRLGGTFLGFRGEALASVVELSQAVAVTTKVDGEVAGSTVIFAASGMIRSSTASHPVGTTIRVQDFLTKLPVRKQTALKTTNKTLEAIKYLLFSFAFARPEIRFSLKVLKGKNDKLNWTYAPTPGRSLAEVATKIVGKEIASECAAYTISSDECDVDIGANWSISAILIAASADPSKVRNATQYVSIDGRPVSMERATMKKIAKSYKHHVQRILLSSTNSSVSRPFVAMQIRCPPESYDVNIEPAKDEVQFSVRRAEQLLSLVECLFNRAYPQIGEQQEVAETSSNTAFAADVSILHRDMYCGNSLSGEGETLAQVGDAPDESTEDTDPHKTSLRNPFIIAAMNVRVRPIKMGTNQTTMSANMSTRSTSDSEVAQAFEEVGQTIARPPNSFLTSAGESMSPQTSDGNPITSPRPGLPMRRQAKTDTRAEDETTMAEISHGDRQVASPQQTGLHAWLTPDTGLHRLVGPTVTSSHSQGMASPVQSTAAGSDVMSQRYNKSPSRSQMDRSWGPGQKAFKVPSKRKPQWQPSDGLPPTPPSSLHEQHEQLPQRDLQGLLAEPPSEGDDNVSLRPSQQLPLTGNRINLATFPACEPPETNPELDEIMDFEHRKKAAIAHQRKLMARISPTSPRDTLSGASQRESGRAREPASVEPGSREVSVVEDYSARFGSDEETTSAQSTPNPHRNRYLKALKDLSHSHPDAESETILDTLEGEDSAAPQMPELLPNDARAYLMRQQRMPSHRNLHRTKTAKLPLESIFHRSATFDLTLTATTFEELQCFQEHVRERSSSDSYFAHGTIEYTDFNSIDAPSINDWQFKVRCLIEAACPARTQEGKERIRDLKIAMSKSF